MKKSLNKRITDLGLSYQKEMTIAVIIPIVFLVGGLSIYFFLKELVIAIGVGLLGFVIDYLYLSRYSTLEKIASREKLNEFISLLSYFEIFISNGNNVYMSFKMLLPYCSVTMEDYISTLLTQIDMDKSVGPYINFATKFDNHIIESLMLSIYQMVDNGESMTQFSEFELLFTNVKNRFQEDLIEDKKKSLDFLNSFPLIGAGFITISLSISIVSMIGDYINVL